MDITWPFFRLPHLIVNRICDFLPFGHLLFPFLFSLCCKDDQKLALISYFLYIYPSENSTASFIVCNDEDIRFLTTFLTFLRSHQLPDRSETNYTMRRIEIYLTMKTKIDNPSYLTALISTAHQLTKRGAHIEIWPNIASLLYYTSLQERSKYTTTTLKFFNDHTFNLISHNISDDEFHDRYLGLTEDTDGRAFQKCPCTFKCMKPKFEEFTAHQNPIHSRDVFNSPGIEEYALITDRIVNIYYKKSQSIFLFLK